MCVNKETLVREIVLRRAGAIAALLACIVYTMLATWHGVLMQRTSAQASTPEAALELALKTSICHGGASEQAIPDAAPAQAPSPGQSGDCPVCKGVAAFQLALVAAAELGLIAPMEAAGEFNWTHQTGADRSSVTPRNRGPPLPV